MNEVEKVIALCKQTNTPISTLEKACGFANGYVSRLRKGFFPPDRKERINAYFGRNIFEGDTDSDNQLLTEAEIFAIEYINADELTKQMIKRLLAYSRKIGGKDA